MSVGCSGPGQRPRGEEADGGERQAEERHRATEEPAAGEGEEAGRFVPFLLLQASHPMIDFRNLKKKLAARALPQGHLMSVVAH